MAPPITCECGTCKKCKWRVYMRGWYAKNAEANRQSAKRSRDRRIEDVRAYDRKRGHRTYDTFKERVRHQTFLAIERGDLTREPCEVCGAEKVDAHHDDYYQPMEVRWLCKKHHGEVHRRYA